MNKYFTMLTKAVLGIIAGVAIMLLDPVTMGTIVIAAGLLWAGSDFLKTSKK